MLLKIDEAGNAVLQDGFPVYIRENWEEFVFDAAAALADIARLSGEKDSLTGQLYQATVAGEFARSKFRAEKMVAGFSAERTEKIYRDNFKVEAGRVVGFDRHGEKIFSRVRPGEVASFDEALEILVEAEPDKLDMLRHIAGSGGNAPGGGSHTTSPHLQFSQIKDPTDRITAARAAGITT